MIFSEMFLVVMALIAKSLQFLFNLLPFEHISTLAMLLDFGRHAAFIWGAYGVTAIGLGGLIIYILRKPRG